MPQPSLLKNVLQAQRRRDKISAVEVNDDHNLSEWDLLTPILLWRVNALPLSWRGAIIASFMSRPEEWD